MVRVNSWSAVLPSVGLAFMALYSHGLSSQAARWHCQPYEVALHPSVSKDVVLL
jgi:hypothetical protein